MKQRCKTPKAHRPARIKLAAPDEVGRRLKAKRTYATEQHVISGAEPIPSGEVTGRHAFEPLRVKANQKPADPGKQLADRSKVESNIASVSFMITQQQKKMLRRLGYTEEQIWEMKPENACTILKEGIKAG